MATTTIRGRIDPKKRAWTQVFFRAGIKFTNDWQVLKVDDATRSTLEAEQMLEIEPVEAVGALVPESKEAATDDPVFVDGLQAYANSVFVDELQAYAAAKVVLPEAAAIDESVVVEKPLADAAPKVVLPEAAAVVESVAVEKPLADAAPKVVLSEAAAVVESVAVEESLADAAATVETDSNATSSKKPGKK